MLRGTEGRIAAVLVCWTLAGGLPAAGPAAAGEPDAEAADALELPAGLEARGLDQTGLEATGLDAAELVRRAEDALRGDTAQMKAVMKITTPRWTRELGFRSWDDRHNDRSFIRLLAPRKDRGTGFLRVGSTLWTYLPRVERTTRIPPSMMLLPWMGSDFSNDDVARESSLIDDYTARALGERDLDGTRAYGVELLPHEVAPVVWSKVEVWVDAKSFAPLRFLYYDEPEPGTFELVRRLHFSDVRQVQGRPVPHHWLMIPVHKEGHRTEIRLEELRLDEPLDEAIFTQANLKRAEAVR